MPKTFTSNLPSVSTGDVYTATSHNNIVTTLNSHTVPPMALAVRTTASATYTLNTDISFESATASGGFDTDSIWSAGSPTRLTASVDGVYLVSFNGYVTMASSGATQTIVILRNGSSIAEVYLPNSGTGHLWAVSHVVQLTAGQYLTFRHTNSGSGAATIYGGAANANTQTRASITFLGKTS